MDNDTTIEQLKTLSVPRPVSNISRYPGGASYAAAARGEIPTVRIGRLLRVPVRAMERKLDAADREPVSV